MSNSVMGILFGTAAVMSLFFFLSVAVFVSAQSQQRQARDRYALLKTLAEHPGETADRVLDLLRDQEDRRLERKEREERKGYMVGGLTCIAAGVGTSVLIAVTAKPGEGMWVAGLIPLLIGCALLGGAVLMRRGASQGRAR